MAKQEYEIGDCLDLIKYIPDNSIDLVVTDPPYNVLQVEWDNDKIDLLSLTEQLYRVVRFGGSVYICCQMPFGFGVYNNMISAGFNFKQDLVWVKNRGFSLTKTIFTKYHENILFFEKSPKQLILKFGEYIKSKRNELKMTCKECREACGLKIYENCGNAGYLWYETGNIPSYETYLKIKALFNLDDRFDILFTKKTFNFEDIKTPSRKYRYTKKTAHKIYGVVDKQNEFEGVNNGFRNPKTTLNYDVIQSGDEYVGHPTQKPLKMIKHLIKASSNKDDIVLDCFLGSGTTLEACMDTERNCIGFELSNEWEPHYKKRLQLNKHKLDKWSQFATTKMIH